jgi:hypothetical protein
LLIALFEEVDDGDGIVQIPGRNDLHSEVRQPMRLATCCWWWARCAWIRRIRDSRGKELELSRRRKRAMTLVMSHVDVLSLNCRWNCCFRVSWCCSVGECIARPGLTYGVAARRFWSEGRRPYLYLSPQLACTLSTSKHDPKDKGL